MKYLSKILAASLTLISCANILNAQSSRRVIEHQVKDNETIYSIAQKYGTSATKVLDINPWAKNAIKAGDKLIIVTSTDYKPQEPTTPSTGKGVSQHIIEAGETLYRIARKYNVSEEDIIKLNPGISAYNFPIGVTLRIPANSRRTDATNRDTTKSDYKTTDETEVEETARVKVLLILPFRKATRYLEFYQGFLMGITDLKKDGINIHLTALEANDDEAVANHIFSGAIQDHDLVIGGVTEEQTKILAQANRIGMYVVPFTDIQGINNSRLIQINQSPSEVIGRVIPEFINKYRGKTVVFARRHEDADDAFAARLKRALRENSISYQSVNISTSSLSNLSKNVVVVPSTPDKDLAEAVMNSLGGNTQCSVFGYPQWQSYGDGFIRQAHMHGTTIYSTFFFDKQTSEAKQFLTKFNAWFNKRVTDSYPKYSVLGYDVARYFIRASAAYGNNFIQNGSQLPSDGLQLDIEVEKSMSHDGYTNSRFYFVTFEQDGTINRQSL